MSTETTFNTIEDMTAWVIARPEYRSTMKFTLRDYTSQEYDNEEEGKAWRAECSALYYVSYKDEPAHTHYEMKKQEIYSRQPKQHQVITWTLEESTSSRNGFTIPLSTELACELNKTWKTGPTYRGSTSLERKGAVTVPGMLKRLGMIGFDKQVKSAKENAELTAKKNDRNYSRTYAIKQAEELHNLLTRNVDAFPAETVMLISLAITNIKNSMES